MQNEQLHKKYAEGRHWDRHTTDYAERFANHLHLWGFRGKLVDLGCGGGRDIGVFMRHGFNATGLDVSRAEIERARSANPNARFVEGDIERLPFEDGEIGAYFMINVAHYVDQEKAFCEIRRTLAPKGLFYAHFNLRIADDVGNIDYCQSEREIVERLGALRRTISIYFERRDPLPTLHTHFILEILLQKQ